MECKICGGSLVERLRYDKMPSGAQHFLTKETLNQDKPITLIIAECEGCGTLQVPSAPVDYYAKASRTTPWLAQDWRRAQLLQFKEEFKLDGKRIKTIMEKPFLPESYNAFLMFNYLEHLPDPKRALQRIQANLDEPGVGIVEVPNADLILQEKIVQEFVIDHLFYYTERTLRQVLELSGFTVLRTRSDLLDKAILSATVQKRTGLDLRDLKKAGENLLVQFEQILQSYKKVTIWGAGHQALFILSQCRLLHKVAYIVDSSNRKQGKYTPVSHIPIHPPKVLQACPVDAIVIMVGGWFQEVVEQISTLNLGYQPKLIRLNSQDFSIHGEWNL
jgi:hypothetical protein